MKKLLGLIILCVVTPVKINAGETKIGSLRRSASHGSLSRSISNGNSSVKIPTGLRRVSSKMSLTGAFIPPQAQESEPRQHYRTLNEDDNGPRIENTAPIVQPIPITRSASLTRQPESPSSSMSLSPDESPHSQKSPGSTKAPSMGVLKKITSFVLQKRHQSTEEEGAATAAPPPTAASQPIPIPPRPLMLGQSPSMSISPEEIATILGKLNAIEHNQKHLEQQQNVIIALQLPPDPDHGTIKP